MRTLWLLILVACLFPLVTACSPAANSGDDPPVAAGNDDDAPPPADDGDEPNDPSPPPADPPASPNENSPTPPAVAPAGEGLHVDYLTPAAFGVLVIRPQQALQAKSLGDADVEELLKKIQQPTEVSPKQVRRITVTFGPPVADDPAQRPVVAIVMQCETQAAADALLDSMNPLRRFAEKSEENLDGKSYAKYTPDKELFGAEAQPMCTYAPSETVRVYGPEEAIRDVIAHEGAKVESELTAALAQLDADAELAAVLFMAPMRESLTKELNRAAERGAIPADLVQLPGQIESITVVGKLDSETWLDARIVGVDKAGAENIRSTAAANLQIASLALGGLEGETQQSPHAEEAALVFKFAYAVLDNSNVERNGNVVTARLKATPGLDKVLSLLPELIVSESAELPEDAPPEEPPMEDDDDAPPE